MIYTSKEDIKEELFYIDGSKDYYITKSANIYRYCGDNKYSRIKSHINNKNGYVYCKVRYKDGVKGTQRVHRIMALTFIPNDNPNLNIVGHKDNIKHNNNLDNLYWTTNQDNIQKAVDDGLCKQFKGINNDTSIPILVTDLNNNILGVYGGVREAERIIDNVTASYICKTARDYGCDYKPRNRRYKYFKITEDMYNQYKDKYSNIKLVENIPKPKQCRIFKAINLITNEEIITDNQKQFAIKYGLEQTRVSEAIINNKIYNNWKFEIIENIDYKDSSGYNNLIKDKDIILKSIDTGMILYFETINQMKKYLGLKGHSIHKDGLILNKWEIVY